MKFKFRLMKAIKILILAFFTFYGHVFAQKHVDKLASLRTSKKIVSVFSVPTSADYAIQIIALKFPAEDPSFFKNVEEAREFNCSDGYTRYCVGSFTSHKEAENELIYYKDLGYHQAFIVNTHNYILKGQNRGVPKGFKPDPNKTYTIQLSAFRFPVYLSYFKGVESVKEFYLQDKIYRYTVGEYKYEDAVIELPSIISLGYKDAYITELDSYLPYQIE